MPREEWDTASNKEAEGGTKNVNGLAIPGATPDDPDAAERLKTDADWLSLVKSAKSSADTYLAGPRSAAANAYRAYRNQHHDKSSYHSDRFKGRSRYHPPKTRTAVHKSDAAAAAALFTTSDVIDVTATNPLNPQSAASASILKEIVGQRLDRSSGKNALPWFPTVIGAHNDAEISGLSISKQYWDRREIPTTIKAPMPDPMTGQPVIGLDGQPIMIDQPSVKVIRDRPMIRLFPMEHVWRDPGADWLDQAQESSFLGLGHPMRIGDAEAFMKANPKSTVKWRPIDRQALVRAAVTPSDIQGVSDAREGKTAQRATNKMNTPAREFDTTWLIEWFIRKEGREWHFWTAYTDTLLSDPAPVEVAYPHLDGERPVVIGVSVIEPHKIDPMSKVQALLPLQQELTESRNLLLDGIKETIRPLTQIRRGSNIDPKALQNRSGDSAIFVSDVENDLNFDRPGDIGPAAFNEIAHLSAEFDDMAGQTNNASIQNNRQLNETVGGLKLLNASANIIADFDLRVWIETWVEPVLRQIVKLEQYYENDKNIIAIAGEKAKLWQYGIDRITEEMLSSDMTVTVSAGIGNSDPEVKLDKFLKAGAAAVSFMGPEVQARAKQDAILDEIFGYVGVKDAAERFFHEGDSEDPRMVKMKEALQQMQGAVEDKQAERDNKVEITRIQAAADLLQTLLSGEMQMQQAQVQHEQDMEAGAVTHTQDMEGKAHDHVHDLHKTKIGGEQKSQQIKEGAEAKAANPMPAKSKTNGAAPPAPAVPPIDPGMVQRLIMQALPQIIPGMEPAQQGAQAQPGAMGGGMGQPQGGGQPQPDQGAAMMDQMMQQQQMLMQVLGQLAASNAQVAQGLSQLAQAHSSPKKVVYDENGRVSHTQAVMPMQ